MLVFVRRLDWDEWNVAHIAKHAVSPAEVEEACHGRLVEYRQSYKDRIVVIGKTAAGRTISVILGQVPDAASGTYYVFTARPSDRKERRFYEQANQQPPQE